MMFHLTHLLDEIDAAEKRGIPLTWDHLRSLVPGSWDALRLTGLLDALVRSAWVKVVPTAGPDRYVVGPGGREFLAHDVRCIERLFGE